MDASPTTFTALLERTDSDRAANERAFQLVYDELRMLARQKLREERSDHTLTPTALVHEAYLKLVDQTRASWNDRQHFLRVAAQAMRRILVSHARRAKALKRGGDAPHVSIDEELIPGHTDPNQLLIDLDEALDELAALDERKSRVVELRYFAGLTADEVGRVLDISRATVYRDWKAARAWLYRRLRDASPAASNDYSS